MTAGVAQFLRFCVVGGIGFAVDGGLTLLLTRTTGLGPLPARAVAFLAAASVTWSLNRRFTFGSRAGSSTWLPYVLLTAVGAFINVGVYWLWLERMGHGGVQILAAVALGSVAAMGFNFFVSRQIVFREASRHA